MSCKDIFTEEERKHLEEVLHADLEIYSIESYADEDQHEFNQWKNLSNQILKKCDLNSWEIDPPNKTNGTTKLYDDMTEYEEENE